ncbi:MAG: trigger factor [Gammaproteobacteria bacterium]|nr:trigger factor [Gammaproteobacteria bacterium]
MQVSVEHTGSLGRSMTVSIPADEVEEKIQARLKNLAKNAKLAGFRPGKAPLKIIDAHYGEQVLQEVAGSLIENSLYEAFSQENLVPAGTPEIEPRAMERGKDIEFTASFDVYPEITKLDLKGVEVERPVCEISEEDIDRTVETMRRQKMSYSSVDRDAREGDQVTVDFKGSIDGEPFAGGEAEDYQLVLGQGQFLEEFENGILGATPGDQRTVNVAFPDDYHGRDVAGKAVVFEIRVKDVAEPELPEVNEEFVKSFGVEDGNIEAFRREIADNLARERDERVSRLVRARVMDALIRENEIEVPEKLVDREIEAMISMNKSMLEQQGMPTEQFDPDREQYRADAEKRVKMGLILSEIVQKNELKADQNRVKERVERMAASYEQPDAFVQWYYSSRERMQQIEATVLEEQVVDMLLEGADSKETRVTLQELTEQPAG